MGKKKKNRIQTENHDPVLFRPFETLLRQGGGEPVSGLSEPPEPPGAASSSGSVLSGSCGDTLNLKGVFSLRAERKGQGGKTVTLISGSCLSQEDAEKLARILRKALGCGSRTEEDAVLLQGDLRERAESWLLAHGAKRVVVG